MAVQPAPSSTPRGHDAALRAGMIALGVVQLALGIPMAVVPDDFVDAVGGYGGADPHFIRDLASWELALAAAALLAVKRASWRLPVLALAAVHWALHAINHLIDIGDTDPGWLGPGNAIALLLGAGLLAWLTRRAA